ncbi:MAG TPA: long-chain fatty acid--CoA ligase [Janibacter terrae]|nr:long-chain fatty acid--CoA ligase [Janibacter terrae]
MIDSSMPRLIEGDPTDSLADLPGRNAATDPQRVAFTIKESGAWRDVTTSQFNHEARALAKGLIAKGLDEGDRLAIMARTRYEWTLLDFATWMAGGVPVPIYETSSPEQVEWITQDAGVRFLVVETAHHASVAEEARAAVPGIEQVWVIDHSDLESITVEGARVDDAQLDERIAGRGRSSIATIIYTSGTTGRPKGCELTHDNFLGLAENTVAKLDAVLGKDDASTLLFLPLAHVFARFIEVLAVVANRRMGHSADIANILEDFQSFRPTFILAVPRVFEKIFNKANETATADGKGKIFARAADVAIAWSEGQDTGSIPLKVKVQHAVFDKLVYSKLRAKMGDKVEYAVSGGAPLGTRLGHFFRGIGVTILEGYGLTETSAAATVNRPYALRVGSVGWPTPQTDIKIAEDGEILIRGEHVMEGYHNNPEATAEVLSEDGWFHSGDIGEIDADGFVKVTDRKKDLFKTSNGKYVAPSLIESTFKGLCPYVGQLLVHGESRQFVTALITLDEEAIKPWAEANGLEGASYTEIVSSLQAREMVQGYVDQLNAGLNRHEQIKKFHILGRDLTVEDGELTPSLKLRRKVVAEKFKGDIEEMYPS